MCCRSRLERGPINRLDFRLCHGSTQPCTYTCVCVCMSRPICRCLPNRRTTLTRPCIYECAACVSSCGACSCDKTYIATQTSGEKSSEHNHWIAQDQIQWVSRGPGCTNETITCRQNTTGRAFNLRSVGGVSSLISPISPRWFAPCWSQMRTRVAQQRPALLIFLLVISVRIVIQTDPHPPTLLAHPLPPLAPMRWVLPSCSPARPDCAWFGLSDYYPAAVWVGTLPQGGNKEGGRPLPLTHTDTQTHTHTHWLFRCVSTMGGQKERETARREKMTVNTHDKMPDIRETCVCVCVCVCVCGKEREWISESIQI